MRQLLCEQCGNDYAVGRYPITPSGMDGLAIMARVAKGQARLPTRDQMTIWVNDDPIIPASIESYLCDSCDAKIIEGANACARTEWVQASAEPGGWEWDYIKR